MAKLKIYTKNARSYTHVRLGVDCAGTDNAVWTNCVYRQKHQIPGMPASVTAALRNVIIARAKWATVDAADRATKTEILNQQFFREEESGERITDTNADFLMSEKDFSEYCGLVYTRNCEKGFDSGGVGLTFWDVKKAVSAAEDALIDTVATDISMFTPDIVSRAKAAPFREKFLKIFGL